jgi:hypothetical protein
MLIIKLQWTLGSLFVRTKVTLFFFLDAPDPSEEREVMDGERPTED